MINKSLVIASCLLGAFASVSVFGANEAAPPFSYLIGKWTQEMIGARTGGAVMNITAVDQVTGQITAKYIPPSGPADGKEFNVTGWVSSAPPQDKTDNVVTVSFTVSLTTYGSISSETGYLKDGKIFAMWHNVRPNTTYDWAHIATGEDIWTKSPAKPEPSASPRSP
jgi:Avidin family